MRIFGSFPKLLADVISECPSSLTNAHLDRENSAQLVTGDHARTRNTYVAIIKLNKYVFVRRRTWRLEETPEVEEGCVAGGKRNHARRRARTRGTTLQLRGRFSARTPMGAIGRSGTLASERSSRSSRSRARVCVCVKHVCVSTLGDTPMTRASSFGVGVYMECNTVAGSVTWLFRGVPGGRGWRGRRGACRERGLQRCGWKR